MKTVNNEKGFVSLLVTFSVVAIGSLIVIQMSTTFRNNQMQHKHNRVYANNHLHLINLAQRIKRGYDLAEMARQSGQSCSGMASGLTEKNLPGHTSANPRTICRQSGDSVCITDPNLIGSNDPICAPLEDAKIDWQQMGYAVVANPIHHLSAPPTGATPPTPTPVQQTQITIPNTADPIWKNCTGNTCMRIVMCPVGETNCQNNEVAGVQTIMLGDN